MKNIEHRDRSKYEAFLGNYQRFESYLFFYNEAFKVLMKDIETSGSHVDRLAYPMLFIARHCLELGFKANIRYFKKYSGSEDFTKSDSHDLKILFNGFKFHVQESIKNLDKKFSITVEKEDITEFNRYCGNMDKLTDYFDQLDKTSFSFRYPVDKNQKKIFKYNDRVNLLDIEELLDAGMVLLNHTSSVFSKYTDYADDIVKIYEDEMRDHYGYM